jgi:hypothetical protein
VAIREYAIRLPRGHRICLERRPHAARKIGSPILGPSALIRKIMWIGAFYALLSMGALGFRP